ncbi:hypothetical protein [Massilia sp. BKSP1R2A-1]|uniref:hypothetical protein n=1 Tax=Massilia sp. BKSP1R2A-1 TaxID=3422595 RepID=UPI003D328AB5
MKNMKWWLKQSLVYGLVAVMGIGFMWYRDDWNAARIAWIFSAVSMVSLGVGVILYCRAKSAARR